ncbi:hypothetical protein GMSM_01440 [Geomonas sp. Red276]
MVWVTVPTGLVLAPLADEEAPLFIMSIMVCFFFSFLSAVEGTPGAAGVVADVGAEAAVPGAVAEGASAQRAATGMARASKLETTTGEILIK